MFCTRTLFVADLTVRQNFVGSFPLSSRVFKICCLCPAFFSVCISLYFFLWSVWSALRSAATTTLLAVLYFLMVFRNRCLFSLHSLSNQGLLFSLLNTKGLYIQCPSLRTPSLNFWSTASISTSIRSIACSKSTETSSEEYMAK